jgi:hypothetical protein
LRALDNLVGFNPFEVVSFTRSLTYELKTTMAVHRRSSCDGTTYVADPDAASVKYRHYERIPVPAPSFEAIWNPRFGKSQAGISAALITQQLSKL